MKLARLALFAIATFAAAGAAHAQVAFRSAATAAAASGTFATVAHASVGTVAVATGCAPTSINPGLPAGTVAGNFLVAVVTSRDNEAISMAAGWNVLYSDVVSTAYQARVFWKIAQGGDATTITKAAGGGCNVMIGRVSRFTGVDNANPFDGAVGASSQTAASVTTGSITTTVATSMLVITAHTADDSNTGSPAGFTEAWDSATTTGNDASIALKWRLEAAAGAKGTFNMTKTQGSDANHGVLFALRPAPSGLTINVPAGTLAGDVMIASIAVRTSAVLITPPAGWSVQAATVQNAGNSSRQQIFYRVATGGEPASYTWTFDLPHSGAAGAILSYSGVDTAAPIDAFAGNTTPQGGDTNLQHRALAVTTTVADAMVVSTHAVSSAVTWTSPGVSERVDVPSQAVPNAAGISLAIYDATQAVAGTTGDRIATANANGDTGSAHFVALRPFVPQPVLTWSLNQLSWNGTAGEVLDLSGNGLHGTSSGGANTSNVTPAIAGNPGSCQYGVFDGNDDFVQVADNALLDVTDELTVMMWLRPTAYPTAGNLKSFVSKDQNYEAHLTSTGVINWWWGGGALELNSAGTVPLNQWTHVALVYSRAGAFQRIYRNGVQDANTNNQAGALVPNNMPFQIAADQGFAGRNFAGWIDEVYVFRNALSASRVAQYMNTTRPCASAIDHFAFSHTGSGVGCVAQQITITAHDTTHTAVDANALAVNLSTSHGKGTWTGIQAGGGTLNDVTAGDGAATYTFALGSNSVTLLFLNTNLTGTSETFNFNVSGGGYSEATGVANVSDDPPFTMYEAGFRFRNIEDANETVPVQISGKASNTGYNARTIRLQAINTNSSTGSCTNLFANQAQTVELGAECNNPAACAARQVSINGANVATSNSNGGAGALAYTAQLLNFNANSEADTVITYPDAGEVSLHAQYDLNPLVAGSEMVGSSNAFVVRPFGLAFPGIAHSNTAAGTVLAAAGDNFAMTVQGYQWAVGEDANDDGVPDAGGNITDNGTVPNFAATASVSPSANLPGVALGQVRRGVGCASAGSVAMSGGAGAVADWCYSEAGNVLLSADVANYIAAGVNITGNSGLDGDANGGYVGRFRPKHFAVTGTLTRTNRSGLSCPGSIFTYMNEALSLGFSLEARNTQNALTRNYTGAYAKLDLSTAANLGIGARSGATNLTGRVDSSVAPTGGFADGVANLVATTGIRRATPDNPDGPYSATQFGIAPNDNDPDAAGGVKLNAFDLDVDNAGGNEHLAIGAATELRFGRLRLQNAYGSGITVLPVPIEVQYWNAGSFPVNADDNCTTLPRSAIAQTFTAPLVACDTAVNGATVSFAGGVGAMVLSAPGAGKTGSVLLTPNLGTAAGSYCDPASFVAAGSAPPSYLLGRWDDAADPDADGNTAYDDKPGARAAFGLYGSQPKNFIFFRENY